MLKQGSQPYRRMTLGQRWHRLIQTGVWKMDIAPTAWIAASALIDRTYPKGIHIGARCLIDEHAVVLTHDLTRGVYLHTTIGERTIIGARAIIMPGITVGHDCVIAPGSLVNRDVPDGTHVLGNPARQVDPE